MAKSPAWQRAEGKNPVSEKACSKCKQVLPLSEFYTNGKKADGSAKYNSWCKLCTKQKMASYHKRTWGPEQLHFVATKRTRSIRAFVSYLLAKAKKRRSCDVSLNEVEQLWHKQDGKCALTGWTMTMVLGKGKVHTNASIDRIDSNKDYVSGNIQLVCFAANVAKSNLSVGDFVKLCEAVSAFHAIQNSSLAA